MTKNTAAAKKPKPQSPHADLAAEYLDPRKLKPWADNPRIHTDEEIADTLASIKRFGFGQPIVARRANLEIIAGHRRQAAALLGKLPLVPVRTLDISEREAHLLALKDNRDVERTHWTAELGKLLTAFETSDMQFAGWTDADLKRLSDHVIGSGESKEISFEAIATEKFAHKCPQCGCEYND